MLKIIICGLSAFALVLLAQHNVDTSSAKFLLTTTYGVGTDTDGDGLSDEDETNIYGTDPLLADTDGDTFQDGAEVFMGTDPLDHCGNTPAADDEPVDPEPEDFNDDQVINILDIVLLTPPAFGSQGDLNGDGDFSDSDPDYSKRKDLTADKVINILDVVHLTPPVFGSSCSAPTEGGYELLQILPTANFLHMLEFAPVPGAPNDVVVATLEGEIWRLALGGGAPSLFGDVSSLLKSNPTLDEGLLGLAFSPTYLSDDEVYLHYIAGDPRRSVFSRFTVSGGAVDLASEEVLLEVTQPFANHNGGKLAFGGDGYLYASLGDGGSQGDPMGNGQDLSTLHGSVLRLDVSGPSGYTVPPDNPFVGVMGVQEEIYAYGMRNPWRFSFDSLTGALWLADVGQDAWEEVEPIFAGGNYGWNVMEGFECYNAANCDMTGLLLPRAVYAHGSGDCSVTGGYVYRGSSMPELSGWYVYGDFCSGRIWAVNTIGSGDPVLLMDSPYAISSFGQLPDGELVIVTFQNAILQLQRVP